MIGTARLSSIDRIGFGAFASCPAQAVRKRNGTVLLATLVMTDRQSIGAHHGLLQGAKVDRLEWFSGRKRVLGGHGGRGSRSGRWRADAEPAPELRCPTRRMR